MVADKRGFALVEIMLVVLIVGLLGAIGMASHLRARERSQEVVCARNRQSIELAERQHLFEEGGYSVTLQDLEEAGYLKNLEPCPAGGDYAWVEYAEGSSLYHSTIACSIHGTGPPDSDEDEPDPEDPERPRPRPRPVPRRVPVRPVPATPF